MKLWDREKGTNLNILVVRVTEKKVFKSLLKQGIEFVKAKSP